MRVVIAEDNPESLYLLEKLLAGNGYDVASAHDGQEALAHLRRGGADLVISDILMPKMDGYQLCREVKRDPGLKDIPFVFYTATYTTERDREFALGLGASRFIVKPAEPEEFMAVIREVLAAGEKGRIPVFEPTLDKESDYLREHNARVTKKLEDKIASLVASDERVRTILESASDAIVAVDRDGLVNSWNAAAERIFGHKQSEILGKNISIIAPAERREEQRAVLARVRQNGSVAPYETVRQAKDGRRLPVEISLGLMRDRAGAEIGVTAVIRDLTDVKERESFIQDLFQSVGEGLAVIGRDYRIRAANPAFAALTAVGAAVDTDALVGKFCHQVTHGRATPCDGPDCVCPVRETFRTGAAAKANHTHAKCGGIPYDAQISSYPIRNAAGEIVAAIEVLRDVTIENKLEQQLRQAQKMESVGQLAGGVAHDFNNLLAVVMGHASLIEMSAEGESQRKSCREILEASERGARLTRSLLAFCRKQVVEAKPVALQEVIGGVVRLLAHVIGEDIEIRTSLQDEGAVIFADSGLIEQVLLNLATNARDAMPGGGVLSIATERAQIDADFVKANGYGIEGNYALITVSDTGAGMDEPTRARAFEPFFTTKGVGQGTGLGLSMVYGTIRQHGGFVHLYSEPGLGTTFKIYLPLAGEPAAQAAVGQKPAVRGGTETILLAEDETALRRLTREVLEHAGYTVVEAADGEQAVDLFREHRAAIGMLLLDVVLPKASGREVFERIRREHPAVKVLFVSGYPADLLRKKGALEAGLPIVMKPLRMDELLLRVREVLDAPA